RDCGAYGGGHLQVIAGFRAVGIHDVQYNFARAQALRLACPPDDVDAGAEAAAVDEYFPDFLHGPAAIVGVLFSCRGHVGHGAAALVAGGDVVKDQLVGFFPIVELGLFDGVAGIDVIEEFHAFDDPRAAAGVIDIEAGDDSFGQHGGDLSGGGAETQDGL